MREVVRVICLTEHATTLEPAPHVRARWFMDPFATANHEKENPGQTCATQCARRVLNKLQAFEGA